MRAIRREKGVLKLVHPGRHIEIHREPITAEEVMRRNPRHCITRPDVFEFPWIVVKPESILLPGRVFFVVPNRTIYNLIKARQPSSQNQQYLLDHSLQDLKQTSLVMYSADISTKRQTFNKFIMCLPRKKSPHKESRVQKQSQVELWPKLFTYRDTQMKNEQHLQEESIAESSAYSAREYQNSSKDNGIELPMKDVNLEFVSNEQVIKLKSCFRKPGSIRRLLDLKVSFDLPVKIEEKQRKYNEDWENFLSIEFGDISIE